MIDLQPSQIPPHPQPDSTARTQGADRATIRPGEDSTGSAERDRAAIRGRGILITGGTGSFGHRVARHLMQYGPSHIRIFSRDEKKQWEMRHTLPDLEYLIGDVRDASRLQDAMRGVDIVFHAAALKQVPACECYPFEALQTNAMGSHNVCRAAIWAGVDVVVALSTDKAVKPVNAMGASKALMEKIVVSQNMTRCDTRFCCVRYGNVMGSRGSVIPLFRRQIEAGGPITITVGHMTRFLMTLDESVSLVLHSIARSRGGEIFVRRAPAATVLDLAAAMRIRYGAGRDIPIQEIGLRPGEKIDEVLVNEYEIRRALESDTYFEIMPEYRAAAERLPECPHKYGYEYTSRNTQRLTDPADIGLLLDRMGAVEEYL